MPYQKATLRPVKCSPQLGECDRTAVLGEWFA